MKLKIFKRSNVILVLLLFIVIVSICLYHYNQNNAVEGFATELKSADEIENELTAKYSKNLSGKSGEDLRKMVSRLRLRLNRYGLYPSADGPDMSKYALKSEIRPEDDTKCIVAKAEDRDKYLSKADLPPQPPQVNLNKYVLKSSIPPEKVCPPRPDIDYSKYVLKSTLPPSRKCPPCICPKVKVSAGLCKKCPPPPKCPEPEPCPAQKCPDVNPCPADLTCPDVKPCPKTECPQLHKIKYIKVPVVITRTIDAQGKVISQKTTNQVPLDSEYAADRTPVGAPSNNNEVSTTIASTLAEQSESEMDNSVNRKYGIFSQNNGNQRGTYDQIEEESFKVENPKKCGAVSLNNAFKRYGVYGYPV